LVGPKGRAAQTALAMLVPIPILFTKKSIEGENAPTHEKHVAIFSALFLYITLTPILQIRRGFRHRITSNLRLFHLETSALHGKDSLTIYAWRDRIYL